jgi:hypothetical protein
VKASTDSRDVANAQRGGVCFPQLKTVERERGVVVSCECCR